MIDYVGEHTFVGELGNTLTIIAIVAALLSGVSYLLAHSTAKDSYRRLARMAFWLHTLALLATAGTLFFMLFNQYFEYDYVWKHANKEMPLRYIFSCFWEGQEGSFLLWGFWQAILGNIILLTARRWENLTMMTISFVQVLIGAMVLGVYVFDFKIGNSPFTLIRELPDNVGLPWTTMKGYLQQIPSFQDGRGLNPLLQNYWMTIHPPTLFLGYSSTIVPFSFAVAGMWSGKFREWIRPAIPWAYFSVAVLGIGILMGGAWAYEALSFGGFWAWDPVENASLIPWLTMVGAAHVMVVNQTKNRSLFTAVFLVFITFILVMYASFLVHSGVLGDTSVHSFTGNGLMRQHLFILLSIIALSTVMLLIERSMKMIFLGASAFLIVAGAFFDLQIAAIVAFLGMAIILILLSYKRFFPKPLAEEPIWSREFWIFIGSLVLLLSAGQVALETSKPIWNLIAQPFSGVFHDLYALTQIDGFRSLADGKLAPQSDRISHFNKWQIPFAFIITFLIGFGQFLRYGKNDLKTFLGKISISLLISLVITAFAGWRLGYTGQDFVFLVLLFTTIFAVVSNFNYIIKVLKGQFDSAGASVAHIGFALVLLGALISTSRSEKISENGSRFNIEQLSEDFKNNEDILLFRADTVPMGNYFVSYTAKEKVGVNVFYDVEYFSKVSRQYQPGDLAIARGAIFEATVAHTPGLDFIMDQQKWEMVEDPRELNMDEVSAWSAFKPGKKLFTLKPHIQLNPEFGNVAEPATKRYWDKDVYTHVRWAELQVDSDDTGFRNATEVKLAVGDTAFVGSNQIRLNGLAVIKENEREKFMIAPNDLAVRAMVGIRDSRGNVYEAEPLFILRDSILPVPDPVIQDETGLRINFKEIDPITGKHTFLLAEHVSNRKEFIVMQAIQFPMINILWIGCIIMFMGTVMAIRHRVKLLRRRKV